MKLVKLRGTGTLLLAGVVFLGGCVSGSQAGGSVAPRGTNMPPRGDQPQGWGEEDAADELHMRRRKLSEQLVTGVRASRGDASRCEKVCSLSVSICSIQEQLCRIAEDHSGSPHYERLCREAKQDCRQSQEACGRCAADHMNRPPGDERQGEGRARREGETRCEGETRRDAVWVGPVRVSWRGA